MTMRTFCALFAGFVLAAQAQAQAPVQRPALPQTYAFTATSNMMGPMTVTVNRNGAREVIDLNTAGGSHLRLLYDFQAHRIFTVDLSSNKCTTQNYVSPYAPVLHDPIGGAEEMARQAGALRTISQESVNGISARLVEAPLEGGQGKYRLWLEEKFGFPVKQAVLLGSEPEKLVFEMRKLSYAPSAQAMFAEPAGCTSIAGTTNANGGSAEINVGATVQAQSDLGGARTANRSPRTGGNVLVGKWDFNGKNGAGVQWKGEIAITKLQPNGFDPADYTNECDVNLSSANSGKGMSGPCVYDSQTRRFSFAGGMDSSKFSFTAVLSPDGKTLAQGKWVEAAPPDGVWSAVSKTAR